MGGLAWSLLVGQVGVVREPTGASTRISVMNLMFRSAALPALCVYR